MKYYAIIRNQDGTESVSTSYSNGAIDKFIETAIALGGILITRG